MEMLCFGHRGHFEVPGLALRCVIHGFVHTLTHQAFQKGSSGFEDMAAALSRHVTSVRQHVKDDSDEQVGFPPNKTKSPRAQEFLRTSFMNP